VIVCWARVLSLPGGRRFSVGKGRLIAGRERRVVFDPDLVVKGNRRRFWIDGSDIKDSKVGGVWCAVGRYRSNVSAMPAIVATEVSSSLLSPGALVPLAMQPPDERVRVEFESLKGLDPAGEVAGLWAD
jgi:hypothetical protein